MKYAHGSSRCSVAVGCSRTLLTYRLRGMFVAVDRTHAVRSVTRPHDASGARTRRFGDSLPSRPEAVLPRAAGPGQDSPLMGARASCPGGGTKRRLQGASATCRSLCWAGPTATRCISPITRNRAHGPGGKARAGTRRPSPCRVSAGWVLLLPVACQQETGKFPAAWAGHGYTARLRGASATCRAVCLGGPSVNKILRKNVIS